MSHRIDFDQFPVITGAIWQAHVRLDSPNQRRRRNGLAWKVLIVRAMPEAPEVVHYDVISEFPIVEVMWDQVVIAITSPISGDPSKPEAIEFQSEGYEEHLRQRLISIGVHSRFRPELEAWQTEMRTLAPLDATYPA